MAEWMAVIHDLLSDEQIMIGGAGHHHGTGRRQRAMMSGSESVQFYAIIVFISGRIIAFIAQLCSNFGISSMEDIQDLFKETIAEFMENGLEAELDDELGYSKYDYKNKDTDNSRNGHSSKTLRTSMGEVEISVPRDRKGEFEPKILKKRQTSISQDIEEKILSMYAKGMTTSDIETHIQDIYGVEVYDTTAAGHGLYRTAPLCDGRSHTDTALVSLAECPV